MVDYNGLAGTEAFGKGYDQASGILSNYNNRKAALQAGDAYAGGNVTGAAGILARNGQIDTARTLNQDAAEQAAAAKKAQQEQASHAVMAMVNMAQGLKQVPAEKRSEAFQKVIAPLLQQQGVDAAHIQQMGQSDFSDQTLDTTIAALGQEGKKYQLANGGDGYFGSFDQSSGTLKTLREAQPSYQPVTVEDANGNKAVIPFNKNDPYGSGASPTQAPQAQGETPAGTRGQRNNNPGNLKWDGRSKWQGMTGVDPQGFVIFDTPDNGVRAAGINLQTQASRGPQTLTSLITKYAPASDNNDTQSYIASVAQQTGLDPSAQIDLTDPNVRQKVMEAMFRVENGGTPVRAPSPPVDNGGLSPSNGMAPIYAAPGFGATTKSPDWVDLTSDERTKYHVPDGVDAQKNTKTGQRHIGTNTTLNNAGKVGTPELRGKIELTFDNMVAAQRQLDAAEAKGYSLNKDWGANMLDQPKDGDWISMSGIGRSMGGEDYQNYTGSAKSIEGALLPIFSGASVTDQEAARYIKANAPEMGDTPQTAKRKSNNRKRMINATAVIAGKQIPFPEVSAWSAGGTQTQTPIPGSQTKRPSLDDIFK